MGRNKELHRKWEYTHFYLKGSVKPFPIVLQEMGEMGWELCAIENDYAYFKRRKENAVNGQRTSVEGS